MGKVPTCTEGHPLQLVPFKELQDLHPKSFKWTPMHITPGVQHVVNEHGITIWETPVDYLKATNCDQCTRKIEFEGEGRLYHCEYGFPNVSAEEDVVHVGCLYDLCLECSGLYGTQI